MNVQDRSEGLRIAVAYPGTSPETFIQAHLDHLKNVVLYLWDGFPPRREGRDRILLHATGKGRMKDALIGRLRGKDLHTEHIDRIAKRLKEHKVEVVLAEYGYGAMEMIDACERAGVPLVAHFFGKDAHGHEYLERYGNYGRLFRSAAALVVVSRNMEEHLLQLGAPRKKLIYICCGVDVERFNAGDPANAPPHFLAVGRFVEKKGPQLTLLAFAEVLRSKPEARLTMVGNGRLFEVCHQMVRALRLKDHVDLCGVKTPAEILHLKRRSRAFVQHSVLAMDGDSEGTPVAIQEAMATGLPVISTRHAGILDVVEHGVHGLLCEPFDVQAMATHMIRLIDEPDVAKELGRNGRERAVNGFPIERQIGKLQDVLQKAANRSPILA